MDGCLWVRVGRDDCRCGGVSYLPGLGLRVLWFIEQWGSGCRCGGLPTCQAWSCGIVKDCRGVLVQW